MASDELFSELPDDIFPQILSSLTLKQRAIASLVSRKWHHMITSLDDIKFVQKHSAYCRNCSTLHPEIIRLAADNNTLTELYLFAPCSSPLFLFPPSIFESRLLTVLHLKSRLLTVLHLKYCRFDEIYIKEFPCLKEIYFDRVAISHTTLSKFIRKCPSIVELTLIRCCYLYSISVPHQNQLKKVRVIYGDRYIAKIEIKALNLMEFHLFTSSSSLEVDLQACTKLQVLNIHSEYVPSGFPQEISSAFPCLKSLSLCLCKRLKKIKLSSPQLENLTLSDMVDLEDAIIDTPNLRSFQLINFEKVPSWCPVVGSSLLEAEIGLKYVHTTNRLLELRTFAENLGENITLSFDTTDLKSMKEVISDSENLRTNIQPLRIKHINLEILFPAKQIYENLIEEVFSYFHPRTLLVRVNSDDLKCNFIQVLSDAKKDQKTNCSKRYKCSNYMSWRNALKSFEIVESTTTTKQGAHQISLEFHWY